MNERLTEKHIVDNIDCGYKVKKDTCEDGIIQGWNKTDAINKLGQLEDIEEELGIDLITLFKALTNGIFTSRKTKHARYYDSLFFNDLDLGKEIINGKEQFGFGMGISLKDYGNTWVLTKEELL